MEEFLDAADHPITFVFLLAIAIACALAIMAWGAKAANLPGLASLLKP